MQLEKISILIINKNYTHTKNWRKEKAGDVLIYQKQAGEPNIRRMFSQKILGK